MTGTISSATRERRAVLARRRHGASSQPPRLYAALLATVALALIIGGVRLASLGGSPYYLLAGLAVAGAA